MKPCPTCEGTGLVEIVGEAGIGGAPLTAALCLTCDGEGWGRDPLVPRDRGVASYRPLR